MTELDMVSIYDRHRKSPPDGVAYSTLGQFQADTERFSGVAELAASLSGMGEHWETHGKTLGEVMDALEKAKCRDWQLNIEIQNPALARAHRGSFFDVWHVVEDIEKLARENERFDIFQNVRGPFALDLISLVQKASGRYIINELALRNAIKHSAAYAKIKNKKRGGR